MDNQLDVYANKIAQKMPERPVSFEIDENLFWAIPGANFDVNQISYGNFRDVFCRVLKEKSGAKSVQFSVKPKPGGLGFSNIMVFKFEY